MTGRAAGHCAGNPAPGYANPIPGRGRGGGRGRGRGGRWGRRNRVHATGAPGRAQSAWDLPPWGGYPFRVAPTREQELNALKDEAVSLEEELGEIRKRVEELETDKNET